jgi:hypothetical protein
MQVEAGQPRTEGSTGEKTDSIEVRAENLYILIAGYKDTGPWINATMEETGRRIGNEDGI